MSVLANEIFLMVASISVGPVETHTSSLMSHSQRTLKDVHLFIIFAGDKLTAPRNIKVLIGYTERIS